MVFALLSVAEAAFSVFLSLLVYRAGRRRFVNRIFSVALLFFAAWIGCAFLNEFAGEYGRDFLTTQFRACYALIVPATGALFLFGLGFLEGGRPKRAWILLVAATSLAVALANLTPWFLRWVDYDGIGYRQETGPLYPFYLSVIALLGGGALFCLTLKRRRSASLDRARASYILAGFGSYIPITLLLSGILPGVMERDVTSSYGTLLAVFPLGVTAYAVVKHRLLDGRLAVRHAVSYLFTTLFFGLPLLLGYALVTNFLGDNRILGRSLALCCLGAAVFLSPAVLAWSRRFSSRLLFTRLYDEVELLDRTFREMLAHPDVRKGMVSGMSLACGMLGLSRLEAVVPPRVTGKEETWVMGAARRDGAVEGYRRAGGPGEALDLPRGSALIREDVFLPAGDPESGRLLERMKEAGIAACFPLLAPGGNLGTLLVGEKENRAALSPLDLDFLEEFARRLGVLLEHQLLLLRLMGQLEEVNRVREEMERSESFKTEIIEISARELRAPVEALEKMVDGSFRRWEELEDEEKKEFLDELVQAGERVDSLVGELLISPFLNGKEAGGKEEMEGSEAGFGGGPS